MLWSVSDNLKQVRKDKERRGMEGATVKAEREILRKQWSDPSASSDIDSHRGCTELPLTGTEVLARKNS